MTCPGIISFLLTTFSALRELSLNVLNLSDFIALAAYPVVTLGLNTISKREFPCKLPSIALYVISEIPEASVTTNMVLTAWNPDHAS